METEKFRGYALAVATAIVVAGCLLAAVKLAPSQPFDPRNPYGYGPVVPYGGFGPDRSYSFGDYRSHLWRAPAPYSGSFWRDQGREWRTPLHNRDYIPGTRGPIPYYR